MALTGAFLNVTLRREASEYLDELRLRMARK